MKSGPTFAGATRWPRRRSAAIRPVATVVLPTPECVPATTTRGPRCMPYVYPTWHAQNLGVSAGRAPRDGVISFIGAGPGAADLLTIGAVARRARADLVLWAGSLVSAEVLSHCRADAMLLDTKA